MSSEGQMGGPEHRSTAATQQPLPQPRIEAILDAVPGVVWEVYGDPLTGTATYCSPFMERLLGYSVAQVLETPGFWVTITPPEDLEPAMEAGRRVLTGCGEATVRTRAIARDGRVLWITHHIRAIDGPDGAVGLRGVSLDATDQVRAEEALRESEAQFRSMLESAPDAMIVADGRGTITLVNGQTEVLFGWRRDEIVGRSVEVLVPKPLREVHVRHRTELRAGMLPHTIGGGGDIFGQRNDGSLIPVEIRVSPIQSPGGSTFYAAVVRDITQRRRAEDALAAEKERLAVTLRSIGDGVIATDTTGHVVLLNRVAEQLTGWAQAEALGRPASEVFRQVEPGTRHVLECPVDHVLATGQTLHPERRTALVARDRTERIIAHGAAPIRRSDGVVQGVVLVFRDVSEADAALAERERASRLESLGLLSGGIAHVFNNLLTSILGNISLARLHGACPVESRLAEAEKAAERARALTQQLLTFATGGAPIRRLTDLAVLVREAATHALAGSNLRPELAIMRGLWSAVVDSQQVAQVVRNLVGHARIDAPEGTPVLVSARNAIVGEGQRLPLAAGGYVVVTVSHSGPGISEESLPKIFDPFYEGIDRDVGLGLAAAYAIAQRHGGRISASSRPGDGCTFELYLPAARQATEGPGVKSQDEPRSGRRVLVMDDEPIMRETVEALLEASGYVATTVADGVAAVTAYEAAMAADEPFDLVILDLVVHGGMGGRETMNRLRALDPQVRAVVSSGYSDDPVMAEAAVHGFAAVLPKPYTLRELREVLISAAHAPVPSE
jgi:PAS domain S-box-containing protein